jgi:hypothetical protein
MYGKIILIVGTIMRLKVRREKVCVLLFNSFAQLHNIDIDCIDTLHCSLSNG